jgi:hypothetical protein
MSSVNTLTQVGVRQRVHGRGVLLVVKELGFLNVRSVEALPMAQTVPCNEDQHPLPKFNLLNSRAACGNTPSALCSLFQRPENLCRMLFLYYRNRKEGKGG